MKHIYIIGAGGVGSWLTPSVCMLLGRERVTVVDGDMLENKNLNRQLFTEQDIGAPKAHCLAVRYGCGHLDQYYSHGTISLDPTDWLLGCVDNNGGRLAILESCDAYGCRAIFGANEVTSAEAYYYQPDWRESLADPRQYYPEIKNDLRNDPRRATIGCTGEAQEKNRQLVTANFMAAALMQHLLVLWELERKKMKRADLAYVPYLLRQNLTKTESRKQIDHQPKE